jgi:hypothetical protein
VVAKRKIPCSCRESNRGRPTRSLVTVLADFQLSILGFRLQCFIFFILFVSYYGSREEYDTLLRPVLRLLNPIHNFTPYF